MIQRALVPEHIRDVKLTLPGMRSRKVISHRKGPIG
jgi:hypothetical protein